MGNNNFWGKTYVTFAFGGLGLKKHNRFISDF